MYASRERRNGVRRAYLSAVRTTAAAWWHRGSVAAGRIDSSPTDVAIAAVLGVLAQLDVFLGDEWLGPTWLNSLAMAAAAIALVWRRSRPVTALVVSLGAIAAPAVAYGASDSTTSLFMVLVATYSAAAHSRSVLVPFLLLSLGIALHDFNDPKIKTFGDATYDWTIVGLTFLVGLTTRWRQRRLEAVEREVAERAQAREAMAAAASAEERRRMARELHDIVSHSLGIVVLQAGAAQAVLDRDVEQARTAMELVRRTGLEAINEMSRLLGLLRDEPDASRTPQPSLADLATLIARTREAGLDVEYVVEGEPAALPAAVELSAYRILQEALTNVLKHAAGSPTRVVLSYSADQVDLLVRNRSSDVGTDTPGGGRGLAGLRERVAVFGGRFDAGPAEGGTWQLHAVLPVP